ncbi:related to RNA binding protein [Rhynchosporium agropyri]|uniref:Related to RNA binding protein n=1 Tax=Rhynchosporium agropyri TaxID=914238 RepID=A0A1E1KJW3_9HELO|nr:related to RNA binding protein [Rhynchosporium agropyri]
MVRGEASVIKCHYKGKTEDFVVFVDDAEAAEKMKTDSTIPLAQVVSSFKIFVSKQGKQGPLDGASNQTLETEFGTSVEEEVIKQIIAKGEMQHSEGAARQGQKNDSMGSRSAH